VDPEDEDRHCMGEGGYLALVAVDSDTVGLACGKGGEGKEDAEAGEMVVEVVFAPILEVVEV